jgi:predicted RecB family nuclease
LVTPAPSVPELCPNMGNTEDSPWSVAKKKIADDLQELTLLWQVGVEKRRDANARGIVRWRDASCTAVALGVTGAKTQPVLQAILDINQSTQGSPVAPPRVTVSEEVWHAESPLEFYVDFETVSDLNDDFSRIPERGGLPIIFMIGCGHMEGVQWKFNCFTTDGLTVADEVRIIDAWLRHMSSVGTRKGLATVDPLIIHWSQAETSTFEDAYNSARTRHPELAQNWPTLRWFDFLKQVFRSQPVVVRGALGFGLKSLAQAMHGHGLITTQWGAGPVDGLGAMVGAWWSYDKALETRMRVQDIDLMQEIQRYNEVDCKVMMEIVCHLRRSH